MATGTIKAVVAKGDIANNLTTSTAGKVLDASQGKLLNDSITGINARWINVGSASNPCTDLESLPINGSGNVVLSASLSPEGILASYSYYKFGTTGGTRYTVLVNRIISTENAHIAFVGEVYDGAFKGWREFAYADQIAVQRNSYTPTISAGTGFTTDNVSFIYHRIGKLLFVTGRFNVTNAGSVDSSITITLPSGMTAYSTNVGSCGGVTLDKEYSGLGLSVRCGGGTSVFIQAGAGSASSSAIGTGYVMLHFTCFLQ